MDEIKTISSKEKEKFLLILNIVFSILSVVSIFISTVIIIYIIRMYHGIYFVEHIKKLAYNPEGEGMGIILGIILYITFLLFTSLPPFITLFINKQKGRILLSINVSIYLFCLLMTMFFMYLVEPIAQYNIQMVNKEIQNNIKIEAINIYKDNVVNKKSYDYLW